MFTQAAFNFIRTSIPPMSRTESEALAAGTVWWDGELFSGTPNWDILKEVDGRGLLTIEEQRFLDEETQELCEMLDDYDICHDRADLPEEVWDFLKGRGFFGMVIHPDFGGLGFSAQAHAAVVTKIATQSVTAAVTVMVPNSLGPGELLTHYGTDLEKRSYLPKLASGELIPCFALTGPHAGSDATSTTDTGRIGYGMWQGEEIVGIYLTFDKRYITLAPVADLMGLAVNVEDPLGLLWDIGVVGKRTSGLTVILMPTTVEGVEIGNRHDPLGIGFMNGPIHGEEVFVPLDMVLGGPTNIGNGWKMLVECLSVGRAISLPSLGVAGGKLAALRTGAYARIRKQFGLPIGKFEGVQEKLAMIAGYAFIMEAARDLTLQAIDRGEKPGILSAINKYHITEMNRQVIDAAMDIQGGSGICLGPNNVIGQIYKSIPISITVEGANILTRNMIIFGQGLMRCHPYVQEAVSAVQHNNKELFGMVLRDHVKSFFKNFGRSVFHGLTGARFSKVHGSFQETRRDINRYSAAFAVVSDITLLLVGGKLKRKERISARLGDILSYMYMLSAVIDKLDVYPREDAKNHLALWLWCHRYLTYKIEVSFMELFRNYPNKAVGKLLKVLLFPYGQTATLPNDNDDRRMAEMLMHWNPTRRRLTEGAFISSMSSDKTCLLEDTFVNMDRYEKLTKTLMDAYPNEVFTDYRDMVDRAIEDDLISTTESAFLFEMHAAIDEIVQVDDFEAV